MKTRIRDLARRLEENICSAFLGKPQAVEAALIALFGGGHLLIEDVPGVGKTLLAQALARSIDGSFRRIQFTPDLLPSDILGVPIFNADQGEFVFKRGPIFANIVLADEINRTSPRTQSALLEAMNDSQVSVDGVTYPLPEPFLVIATQNPYDFDGTYPLPGSQLDRFMLHTVIGYPNREAERQILRAHNDSRPIDRVQPVISVEEVLQIRRFVRSVEMSEDVERYLLDVITHVREHPSVHIGPSPRASLALYRATQCVAFLAGRDYCLPDDVKSMIKPVLSHRIVTRRGDERMDVALSEILDEVPVPV